MAKTLTVKAAGLFLDPNDLGSVPEGALSLAYNVVIRKDNVIEPRRGTKSVSSIPGFLPKKLKENWKDVLLAHAGANQRVSNAAVSAWTTLYPEVTTPDDCRVELVGGGGNMYLTSNEKPRRLEGVAGPVEDCGVPACDIIQGSLFASTGGTALAPLKTISYRVVFGKQDAADRLILGRPSGRGLVVNTDVALTFNLDCFYVIPYFPFSTTTGMYYPPSGLFARLYRTESVDNGVDPGDEHGLVLQEDVITPVLSVSFARDGAGVVTITTAAHGWAVDKFVWILIGTVSGGGITLGAGFYSAVVTDATHIELLGTPGAGTGTFAIALWVVPRATSFGTGVPAAYANKDAVPDGYLGAALYTNPSQGRGIADASIEIANARHLEQYQGAMFFSDITYPSRADIYLLAVGGTYGLALGDTITINGHVFTAAATTDHTAGNFYLATLGTPAENIRDTMQALCLVVSLTGPDFTMRAEAGPADIPGFAVLEFSDLSDDLVVTVSRSSAWSIQNLKERERIKNELRWSLNQQPDMTPVVDYARIGDQDSAVLCKKATRSAMFVFKEDGLYIVRGTTSPWVSELLDPSVILTAIETAVVLDNQIYCLTTRGVMRVSETGVTLLSRPIESALENLDPDDVAEHAFAVGYEEDHCYMLWIPRSAQPSQAEECYVYDVYTDAWTYRDDEAAHAVVHNRKLYQARDTEIREERKLFATPGDQDYELAEDEYAITISVGGTLVTSITLADATEVIVGDAVVQGASVAIVTAKVGNVLTLDRAQTWTAAAATSYRCFECAVQWSPKVGTEPSTQNRFKEFSLLFRNIYFAAATVGMRSAHDPSWTEIPLLGSNYGWDGSQVSQFALRALIDPAHAVSTQLDLFFRVTQALTPWKLQGLALQHKPLSGRTSK
jgi:hypothetical protein